MKTHLYRLPEGRTAMKTHDVRHVCLCTRCNDLADDRTTVDGSHPKCFFEKEGRQAVIALPDADRAKFRMSDIPRDLTRDLLSAMAA